MSAAILRGDARNLPLPDHSVDLIVTSPPYYGLRSYTDGGEHYAGQIGGEPTPAGYVAALIDCTREWCRVLKPAGSLFINLGDAYSGGSRSTYDRTDVNGVRGAVTRPRTGIRGKSLVGLPWRYALACIDELGLILRAEIIWSKPNGLPESVTDRVRRSHEQLFHFTRQPRYYSAVDEIREEHQPQSIARTRRNRFAPDLSQPQWGSPNTLNPADACNPLGKLPGSVWDIATQPLTVPASLGIDHFAAFPLELPRRCILGWSPPGICAECGEGRRPVVDKPGLFGSDNNDTPGRRRSTIRGGEAIWAQRMASPDRITGYACACPDATAPTRPALVVDPFGGTGTTALVADVLGRHAITIDRSADYCRIARWRTTNPGERARAMQVPKPPAQLDGQATFDDLEQAMAT